MVVKHTLSYLVAARQCLRASRSGPGPSISSLVFIRFPMVSGSVFVQIRCQILRNLPASQYQLFFEPSQYREFGDNKELAYARGLAPLDPRAQHKKQMKRPRAEWVYVSGRSHPSVLVDSPPGPASQTSTSNSSVCIGSGYGRADSANGFSCLLGL